jgi:hypothetical protein
MSKTVLDAPIYIDTYELAKRVYDLRFALPKRDRAVLGDRMLDAVMAMLSDFTMSYKLRGADKLAYTDMFMAHFEVLKGILRLSREKKVNDDLKNGKNPKKDTKIDKKYVSTFEYMQRIDDGIIAWREKIARVVRSTAASRKVQGIRAFGVS